MKRKGKRVFLMEREEMKQLKECADASGSEFEE